MPNENDPYSALEEGAEPSPSSQEMGDKEAGETTLIPKSFFEGQELKPGQQYYVEIVREYEDEVEVKYPHQVKEEKGEKSEKPTAKADAALDEMMGEPANPGKEY